MVYASSIKENDLLKNSNFKYDSINLVHNPKLIKDHLFDAIESKFPLFDNTIENGEYISLVLKASDLCIESGQDFPIMISYLERANNAAERIGDQRSCGLINLHMGRLYYFANQRKKSLLAFSKGKEILTELGDEDIHIEASELIGLYYHIQGYFKEALQHFQKASKNYMQEKRQLIQTSSVMWMSYCDAYLGLFPRAIGRLDYHFREAFERNNFYASTTFESVLGIILLMINKLDEAQTHLSNSLKEALKIKNNIAIYFSKVALSYIHLKRNKPRKAAKILSLAVKEAKVAGVVRQYASPFVIEMIHEFDELSLEPFLTEFRFNNEVERLMNEPNIHLRGVALRLRAMKGLRYGDDLAGVESDLEASEAYLINCGDPIQLGKTRVQMAITALELKNYELARSLAQKAWNDFSGYGEVFYPNKIKHLLTKGNNIALQQDSMKNLPSQFLALIEDLLPDPDLNNLLEKTLVTINKVVGAERSGIFLFNQNDSKIQTPTLLSAYNLTKKEVLSEDFKTNLSVVYKSFKNNQPIVHRNRINSNQVTALLCIPFEVNGQKQGVIYNDNSYLNDCFDIFDKELLTRLSKSLSRYINRIWVYGKNQEQARRHQIGSITHSKQYDLLENLTANPKMKKLLSQVDQIAASESTVLLYGETGVGKSLLAHRVHNKSQRLGEPFIIVDVGTIPDNLSETELFGHEKGAFTGADSKKIGKVELAHQGTLFLDEISEIPKSLQVKFLRVLQDKAFTRVGSALELKSNFRLIAATNRNLAEEVEAGRFREDLYYRLNVIPIHIPPLRERPEDIPLITDYFMNYFSEKYGLPAHRISEMEKKKLTKYRWPGNIRELKNIIERAVLLSSKEKFDLNIQTTNEKQPDSIISDTPSLDELQRRYIQFIFHKTHGKITGTDGAAELLGMKRSTLYNRMKKLGLR